MAQLNSEKIISWVTKNVGKVVLGVQVLLVAATGFLVYQESGAPSLPMPEVQTKDPAPQLLPKDPKTPKFASYEKVMSLVRVRPALEDSDYVSIIQINTFDPKTVKNSDQLTKEADKAMGDAKTLFEQGDLDGADAALKKILDSLPGHKGSLELKKKIAETRKGGKPAAGAAGAAGTPAGTPAAATPAPAAPAPPKK